MGKRLKLPEWEGKIIRYNLIRETVTVELEDKRELEVPLSQVPTAEGKVEPTLACAWAISVFSFSPNLPS